MAKKRVKISRKSPLRKSGNKKYKFETNKVTSSSSKIKSIAINLIVFAALSLLLYILSIVTNHSGLQYLFEIFSYLFAFVGLAFLIVLLVFVLIRISRK